MLKKLAALSHLLYKRKLYSELMQISSLATNYIIDKSKNTNDGKPYVINIEDITNKNKNFRTTKWTGKHFQMTLMSLLSKEDIGLEVHKNIDQFIRVESGKVKVLMGKRKDDLSEEWIAKKDFTIFIPAGTWHNIINIGSTEAKLYLIYAAPEHKAGLIQSTKPKKT